MRITFITEVRLFVNPQKQTFVSAAVMSALCQKRTSPLAQMPRVVAVTSRHTDTVGPISLAYSHLWNIQRLTALWGNVSFVELSLACAQTTELINRSRCWNLVQIHLIPP
jgi:hypothetical protein